MVTLRKLVPWLCKLSVQIKNSPLFCGFWLSSLKQSFARPFNSIFFFFIWHFSSNKNNFYFSSLTEASLREWTRPLASSTKGTGQADTFVWKSRVSPAKWSRTLIQLTPLSSAESRYLLNLFFNTQIMHIISSQQKLKMKEIRNEIWNVKWSFGN